MTLRWFISKTVRHATAMRKHVRNILNAQRDILSPQAVQAVGAALDEFGTAIKSDTEKSALLKQMEKLEDVANKWLKPYPNAGYRENVEVFLVALAVAMGIRTFFVQPFKIPTGSMQPTLFGVTSTNLVDQPGVQIPTGLERIREWFAGVSYVDVIAKADGVLERIADPVGIRVIDFWQTIYIGGVAHMMFFPPDYGGPPIGTLQARSGLRIGEPFRKGDQVVRLKTQSGDHLFVDRLTYNFRKPKRGEIIVFATKGIDEERRNDPQGRWQIPDDQFYIKRQVALSGERAQIGQDHHLIINGQRLDTGTPGFENVYKLTHDDPQNDYNGHLPIQLFADGKEFQVRSNHFMVMGDNTGNSLDSRFFADVDADYIIGKSSFVYWPITSRFGLGYR
ncbi:MAG: signal peptidase I [Pedosphaera sp.]|nr:signal peptidase I [Pedosphaera sp.]